MGGENKKRIKSFTELVAWQAGHQLVLEVYKITKNFPREETYVLVSQMRRCAISITSNTSEGFSRDTRKEKNRFYNMALSSLTELQNQLIVSRDLYYLEKEKFNEIAEKTVRVSKLINGLIKSSKSKNIPNT